ncbi:Uncharacterised protein [Bordetella pertussis]|nr:Uncharacterised protein [Bordetella pertussis]
MRTREPAVAVSWSAMYCRLAARSLCTKRSPTRGGRPPGR